jgi:hypothetical protein
MPNAALPVARGPDDLARASSLSANVDAAWGTFMRFVDAFDPENGHQAAALIAAIQHPTRAKH